MKEVLPCPASVEELVDELHRDVSDPEYCYVWRGQGDAHCLPYPGLYRRLINNGYNEERITEDLVCEWEAALFRNGSHLGLRPNVRGSKLSFMVKMQHLGAATRMLDVTRDPFVALFFAVSNSSQDDRSGIIYKYAIKRSCVVNREEASRWRDVTARRPIGWPTLFFPRAVTGRIAAQSAGFLMTRLDRPLSDGSVFSHETSHSKVQPITVGLGLKEDIRDYLLRSRGLREFDLFPDLEGYAKANSQYGGRENLGLAGSARGISCVTRL